MILHFQYNDGDEELEDTQLIKMCEGAISNIISNIKSDPRDGTGRFLSSDKSKIISDVDYKDQGGHCVMYAEYHPDNINDLFIDTDLFEVYKNIEIKNSWNDEFVLDILRKIDSLIHHIVRDSKINGIVGDNNLCI